MNKNLPTHSRRVNRWRLFTLVLILGAALLVYRILEWRHLDESAALYLGLPLLIALGVSLTPQAKSVTGAILKALTLALLLSAPILQEGFICILFAAPIFYTIGVLLGVIVDYALKHHKSPKLKISIVALAIALLALEGTHPNLTYNRYHQVQASKIVPYSIQTVRAQLAQPPQFSKPSPWFLRIFPKPIASFGSGLGVGDKRIMHFSYKKHLLLTPQERDLFMQIDYSSENKISFRVVKNTTYIARYLKLDLSEVELEPIDAQTTRITWKLAFIRNLDPFWYVAPLQMYAAYLAAQTLIDNVATPTN